MLMGELMSGLIGALIGAILSFVVSFLTLRFSYKHLYAEVVSKSRDNWLDEMRHYISEMLAQAIKQQDCYKNKDYYVARNEVVLRLNPKEPLHLILKEEISRLDDCTIDDYNIIERNILETSRLILKTEWDRVREEAKGVKQK